MVMKLLVCNNCGNCSGRFTKEELCTSTTSTLIVEASVDLLLCLACKDRGWMVCCVLKTFFLGKTTQLVNSCIVYIGCA